MKSLQCIVNFFAVYREWLEAFLLIMLTSAALYTDIKSYKIPNKLNLIFIILGLLFNIIIGNFKNGVIGMLFPMVLFPLFCVRMIGAGDIKLFCAIGSIVTFPNILSIMAYSILFNGIIAVFLLVIRKEYGIFLKLFDWLKFCVKYMTVVKYQILDSKSKSSYRYAYGIMLGSCYYIVTSLISGGRYALL